MKFSKKLQFIAIGLILSLALSTQTKCVKTDKIHTDIAKNVYEKPYIYGTAAGLTVAKFFKASLFKRFTAFSLVASAGTFISQAMSENYLKNNLNCFEWMTTKTPPFKAKTDEFIQKLKNLFN